MLGSGFAIESLEAAAVDAAFIGCDAGSTDAGAYYLGAGEALIARDVVARDLEAILAAGLRREIPVLIGSAGTGGGRPHLQWLVQIVRDLAAEHGWHFTLGSIDSELSTEALLEANAAGHLSPLDPAPELDEDALQRMTRTVAMLGVEPYQEALRQGAQVIIGGRTSDPAIYAALPLLNGIPAHVAWHAGKILECGAACVEQRAHPDSLIAELDTGGFTVAAPNPAMRCTPESIISHSLYERSDPHRSFEPGGVLETGNCTYDALDTRTVRVTGGHFRPMSYTVRLEGAELVGYRSIAIGGIRDPLVLGQMDDFLAGAERTIKHKVQESLGLGEHAYSLRFVVYGRDGAMGPREPTPIIDGHEVGVLTDVVAETQELARAIIFIAWHTTLHHAIPQYSGLTSHLAFPFSPPEVNVGPVFRFGLNHVLHIDSPNEMFPVVIEQL
jgi:hypothetical protein